MNMFKPLNAQTPQEYLAMIDEPRQSEMRQLMNLIQKECPAWKPYIQVGMVGFGSYHYKYASGREGDWAVIGLASQKNYISLYICVTTDKGYLAESYVKRLPKASIGKSCVRFKKLADADLEIIRELVSEAYKLGKKMTGRE